MNNKKFCLQVTATSGHCDIGETVGMRNAQNRSIPVLSCEGACIRGEIARLAANRIGATAPFARACHGELFTVPDSSIARWVKSADHIVVVDGCHLRCHARVVENLVGAEKLRAFNASARHQRYCDVFSADEVPQHEREAVAKEVADWVIAQHASASSTGCASAPSGTKSCCASSPKTNCS